MFQFAHGRHGEFARIKENCVKFESEQIYRNRYQVPNMNELVDKMALAIIGDIDVPTWFLNIDLKYNYSQMKLSEETIRQCNSSIFGEVKLTHTTSKRVFTA